jgi:hypothetical protein
MTTKHNKKRMGVKRKSKGTNDHKLKGPKQGGREDFPFAF